MSGETIDFAALAAEEARLAEQAERIAQRREEIKNTLREHLPVGTHKAGAYTVQVRTGARRLDLKEVAANLPFEDHAEIYGVTVDAEKVRRHLSPAELEAYTTQGAATVIVK